MTRQVAGHVFDSSDRCVGNRTLDNGDVVKCGKRWIDLMHCDEGCVGKEGHAHIRNLTPSELSEIRAEVTRREKVFTDATHGVAGGGYAAPDPLPSEPAPPDAAAEIITW